MCRKLRRRVRRRPFDDGEVACVRFLNIDVHYKKSQQVHPMLSDVEAYSEATKMAQGPHDSGEE